MSDVYFYHLTNRRLETTLPGLLQRSLEKDWKALVCAGSSERVEDIDRLLWSFADESFLPHGVAGGAYAERQPVLISTEAVGANTPDILFLTDGTDAATEVMAGYKRVCVLFEARDPEAIGRARALWKTVSASGMAARYFAERPSGGWEEKASANIGSS